MLSRAALQARLVEEWKDLWKHWSVQLNALGLVLMALGEFLRDGWSIMPASLAQRIPHAETIGLLLFGLALIARFLKQGKKSHGDAE